MLIWLVHNLIKWAILIILFLGWNPNGIWTLTPFPVGVGTCLNMFLMAYGHLHNHYVDYHVIIHDLSCFIHVMLTYCCIILCCRHRVKACFFLFSYWFRISSHIHLIEALFFIDDTILQVFGLSIIEIGTLLSLSPSEQCEFFHDPFMGKR